MDIQVRWNYLPGGHARRAILKKGAVSMNFEVKDAFYKDGEPIQILSGAVHYFRSVPEYWEDTLQKLKAAGFNTVETYCPWNLHEKEKGTFDFSGMLDVERFIRLAGELGLMVIVRPGPYICSEWEFGGLPWWLQNEPGIEIRCMNDAYLACVDCYLDEILARVRPLLATNGGPVIMLQVENEYGYYANDHDYLAYLRDGFVRRGIDVPLVTSDGVRDLNIQGGSVAGCLETLNFGSDAAPKFETLHKYQQGKPDMCMEFWNGWFDAWGDAKHGARDPKDAAAEFEKMLKLGSVNVYMFHGGTNFGFMNGANHDSTYRPTVSSYDYDALLTESGDVTEKYRLFRNAIAKHTGKALPEIPADRPKAAYGTVKMDGCVDIFNAMMLLTEPKVSRLALPMERYGQGYGYICYQARIAGPLEEETLRIEGLGDRVQVYLDRKLIAICSCNEDIELKISVPGRSAELFLIVENMGRANFGRKMSRLKGIAGPVTVGEQIQTNWAVYPLPMDNIENLTFYTNEAMQPTAFYRGRFNVTKRADTFLRTDDFTKGCAFLNGFNLGRFWEAGPTKTLYIPAPLLREGENELVIFESDGAKTDTPCVQLTDAPDLG